MIIESHLFLFVTQHNHLGSGEKLLQICLHLLKESSTRNFIFGGVYGIAKSSSHSVK